MTPDEARTALAAHLADLSAGSVRIRSSLGATTIAFTDVGRVPDIDAMVAQAVALGRGGTWLDETIAGIRLQMRPETVDLRLGYDHDRAAAAIAGIRRPDGLECDRRVDRRRRVGLRDHRVGRRAADRCRRGDRRSRRCDAGSGDPGRRGHPGAGRADRAEAHHRAGGRGPARRRPDRHVLEVSTGASTWKIRPWRIRPWISFAWVDGVYRPVIDRSQIPRRSRRSRRPSPVPSSMPSSSATSAAGSSARRPTARAASSISRPAWRRSPPRSRRARPHRRRSPSSSPSRRSRPSGRPRRRRRPRRSWSWSAAGPRITRRRTTTGSAPTSASRPAT